MSTPTPNNNQTPDSNLITQSNSYINKTSEDLLKANDSSNTSQNYNLEKVLTSINDLFVGQDATKRKEANKFLLFFEKSQQAWDIAKEILSTKNLLEQAYYSATQIIKKKLRFDFGNYCGNKQIIISVAEFLIEKLVEFKENKVYIVANLCRCFALFVVFAHQDIPDIIKVFVNKLNDQSITGLTIILMVFSFLAEMVETNNIVIDEAYKVSYCEFLEKVSDDVLIFMDFMIKYSKENKEEFLKRDPSSRIYFQNINKYIVECFNNWIKKIFGNEIILKLKTDFISIIDFIFEIDDDNLEVYSECVCNLLKIPLQENDNQLAVLILNRIYSFKNRVYQAIKMQDEGEIKFFIDIFIHLSENNMDIILKQKNFEILSIILDLTKSCPLSRMNLICDFWCALIIHRTQINLDSDAELDKLFFEVVSSLKKYCLFPDKVFHELNTGDIEQIKNNDEFTNVEEYREKIKEFLVDVSAYLGFDEIYQKLILPDIQNCVQTLQNDPNNITIWAFFEANVFILCCVCNSLNKNENCDFLNELINTLIQIPDNLQKIKLTFIDLIDQLSSYLKINQEILISIFKYLVQNLDNKSLVESCSFSIKNILLHNSSVFLIMRQDLIVFYNTTLKEKLLQDEVYEDILEGLVNVLASNTNFDETKEDMIAVFYPWIFKMTECAKLVEKKEISRDQIYLLTDTLEIIKIISRSLFNNIYSGNRELIHLIFLEVWPTIKYLFENLKKSDVIGALTHIVKYFMRGLGEKFIPYLPDYKQIIIEGYNTKPCSSYIYAYENICSVFAQKFNMLGDLTLFLKELFLITFSKYLTTDESYDEHSDITKDFFGLLFHVIKLNPVILFNLDILEELVSLSISKLGITHIDSLKNLIYFLEVFVTFNKKESAKYIDEPTKQYYFEEKVVKLIKKHGNEIVKNFILVTIYKTHKAIFDYTVDFLFILIKLFKNECVEWFTNCKELIPSDCLTESEKNKLIMSIQNFDEKATDEQFNNFYNRCERRYHRMRKFNI